MFVQYIFLFFFSFSMSLIAGLCYLLTFASGDAGVSTHDNKAIAYDQHFDTPLNNLVVDQNTGQVSLFNTAMQLCCILLATAIFYPPNLPKSKHLVKTSCHYQHFIYEKFFPIGVRWWDKSYISLVV